MAEVPEFKLLDIHMKVFRDIEYLSAKKKI